MKSYSTFHFSGYSWNHHAGKISLKYALDSDVYFEETILLPEPISDERLKAKQWEIERALFALHMIGGISYYKTCLPKNIAVESGNLSKFEASFWNTVYERGLGEFFYRNNIDFRGLINFTAQEAKDTHKKLETGHLSKAPKPKTSLPRILVPVGGGKDSVVTMELLKKSGANITLLRMGQHPLIDELALAAGLPMITVRRTLPSSLFSLNKEGALNGHVPITAYLSILSVLIAILYDFDGIAMSNERSANFGNVDFKGLEVNHQWSKSFEFEKLLRRYVTEVIGSNTEYFSALRPYSELKIAELFSKYPQYFEHVTSCNTNWKILADSPTPTPGGKWCCECPKCAFVFAALAAFVPKKTLTKMFGKNLFECDWLMPLFRELLGIANFKPFECVGTPEETAAAFLLAHKNGEYKGTPVMTMFEKEVLPTIKDPEGLIKESLTNGHQDCIPQPLKTFLL